MFALCFLAAVVFLIVGALAWVGDRLPQTTTPADFEGDDEL